VTAAHAPRGPVASGAAATAGDILGTGAATRVGVPPRQPRERPGPDREESGEHSNRRGQARSGDRRPRAHAGGATSRCEDLTEPAPSQTATCCAVQVPTFATGPALPLVAIADPPPLAAHAARSYPRRFCLGRVTAGQHRGGDPQARSMAAARSIVAMDHCVIVLFSARPSRSHDFRAGPGYLWVKPLPVAEVGRHHPGAHRPVAVTNAGS